ncbi:glycosyltransferase [Actinomycetospora lutea]|uniref:glycosyltransferase n=1 Tax=Actinomycetospora lutea TaxID=663604 RepID=UPI002366309D|nr:glycosyltransferase [Actinomycetospora lutea]MDD7941982.1 glycosyltransferase [Actinomycetospora lutea]
MSEPVAADVRTYTRAQVVVAPNAPAPQFAPLTSVELEQTLEDHGLTYKGYLLSVASVDPRKNIAALVDAFLSLPLDVRESCPLVLAGGSNASFAMVDIVQSPSVVRLGYVGDELLAELYAGARAVVLPSLDEGFGLPVVEALSAGTDVLVSDTPVMRWVGGDSVIYIEGTPTSDNIAPALRQLLRRVHPPREEALGRAEAVARRFAWPTSADVVVGAVDRFPATGGKA